MWFRNRPLRIVAGGTLAVLLFAPQVVPIFVPWSGINCHHEDINIKTGQARITRKLWFLDVSTRVQDTELSRALGGNHVEVTDIEEWHRVNTFCPGVVHSPHYRFHGAFRQAHDLKMLESMEVLSQERKREIVISILTAWQRTGDPRKADKWMQNLLNDAISKIPD